MAAPTSLRSLLCCPSPDLRPAGCLSREGAALCEGKGWVPRFDFCISFWER